MSNLIVFLFNHFPVFIVGFNVKVVCESLVKICEERNFETGSRLAGSEKHILEYEQSHARLDFSSYFATQAKSRVTRKTHCLELFKVCLSQSFTNTI